MHRARMFSNDTAFMLRKNGTSAKDFPAGSSELVGTSQHIQITM